MCVERDERKEQLPDGLPGVRGWAHDGLEHGVTTTRPKLSETTGLCFLLGYPGSPGTVRYQGTAVSGNCMVTRSLQL